MKITASQLRMIIKEEVKRAKRVNLHEVEMVDDPTGMSLVDDIKKQLKGVVLSAIGTQFGYDNPDLEDIIEMNIEAEGTAIENIVQNTLEEMGMKEDPVQMKVLVLDKLEEEYGGEGYDLQGIVDTVFRDLTRSGTLSGMSVEDIVEQCRELMD